MPYKQNKYQGIKFGLRKALDYITWGLIWDLKREPLKVWDFEKKKENGIAKRELLKRGNSIENH